MPSAPPPRHQRPTAHTGYLDFLAIEKRKQSYNNQLGRPNGSPNQHDKPTRQLVSSSVVTDHHASRGAELPGWSLVRVPVPPATARQQRRTTEGPSHVRRRRRLLSGNDPQPDPIYRQPIDSPDSLDDSPAESERRVAAAVTAAMAKAAAARAATVPGDAARPLTPYDRYALWPSPSFQPRHAYLKLGGVATSPRQTPLGPIRPRTYPPRAALILPKQSILPQGFYSPRLPVSTTLPLHRWETREEMNYHRRQPTDASARADWRANSTYEW